MEKGYLVKKITKSDVGGTRPRGRSRTEWTDSEKKNVRCKRDVSGARKTDCV